MSTVEKRALDIIKLKAKSLGLTQVKVAAELQVSLPTVKRWWAGKAITVKVLEDLCHAVGFSLANLFLEAEAGTAAYFYTEQQEQIFFQNPKILALFDLLVSGETVNSVQKKYSVAQEDMFKMLLKLDRMGLIELSQNNKIKLLKNGEPQWIPGGLLAKKYRKSMIDSLLGGHEKNQTTFFIHNYLQDDLNILKVKLQEIEKMMLSFNLKGNLHKDTSQSFGVYLTLKPFEWDLRDQLKK